MNYLDWYGLRLAMGAILEVPPGVLGATGAFLANGCLFGPLFIIPNEKQRQQRNVIHAVMTTHLNM